METQIVKGLIEVEKATKLSARGFQRRLRFCLSFLLIMLFFQQGFGVPLWVLLLSVVVLVVLIDLKLCEYVDDALEAMVAKTQQQMEGYHGELCWRHVQSVYERDAQEEAARLQEMIVKDALQFHAAWQRRVWENGEEAEATDMRNYGEKVHEFFRLAGNHGASWKWQYSK